MSDLPNTTQDVSIFDNESSNYADVTDDHELLTHDPDVLTALEDLTAATAWQTYGRFNQAFCASHELTLGSSGQADVFLIKNPTASGISARIKDMVFGVQTPSTGITFRIYRDPTVTSDGTAHSEVNFRDTSVTGLVQTFFLPTISARGEVFKQFDTNSSGTGTLIDEEELALIVDEGEYLLLTAETSSANKTISFNISWAEDGEI